MSGVKLSTDKEEADKLKGELQWTERRMYTCQNTYHGVHKKLDTYSQL